MQHRNMILVMCLVVSSLVSLVTAKDDEATCNDADIAMTMCKEERQELSYTSQLNNILQLCRALRHYTDCMKPQMRGCIGPAKMAFDVIISKYTGEPYKCNLDMQTEKMDSNDSHHINQTSTDKKYKSHKTTSQVIIDNSLDGNDIMDSTDNMNLDTQEPANNSTKTTHAQRTNAQSGMHVHAATTSTNRLMAVSTSFDVHNCATLANVNLITVFVACITSQIWLHVL